MHNDELLAIFHLSQHIQALDQVKRIHVHWICAGFVGGNANIFLLCNSRTLHTTFLKGLLDCVNIIKSVITN